MTIIQFMNGEKQKKRQEDEKEKEVNEEMKWEWREWRKAGIELFIR